MLTAFGSFRMLVTAGGVVAALAVAAVLSGLWLAPQSTEKALETLQALPARATTRFFPPSTEGLEVLQRRERRAVRQLARRLDARIVWSSNRSGNHELYLVDLGKGEVTQLTDDPHVDFFGRFSPDGERIVFVRSQQEWVSFRDIDSWDLWLMNADGTEARRLAGHAYHPTWGPDGKTIVFQRHRSVWAYDLDSGEERLLYEPGPDFPGTLGDPKMSSGGDRLVLATLHTGIGIVDLETAELRHLEGDQACQTDWGPDDRTITWVGAEGNGGTRIMQGATDGSSREVLIDLPGDYSHEYFPTLSDDGAWLVWGASRGGPSGHEHDRADYEIFVWEVGTGWDEAVRLTYFSGNDQWPDIHVRR